MDILTTFDGPNFKRLWSEVGMSGLFEGYLFGWSVVSTPQTGCSILLLVFSKRIFFSR